MKRIQNKLLSSAAFMLTVFFLLAGVSHAQTLSAVITTEKGEIKLELFDRNAPLTVANFVNLVERGFYDGLTFHRVERRFMIQGGDPVGNGTGGPGYRFAGELTLRHNRPGMLSMANSGPGTEGSQFFITHVPTPHLDGLHSVFGRVTEGMEVVNRISRGDVIEKIEIIGDTEPLKQRKSADIERWNAILDAAQG
ncbi:MAG: peptidylprolyl isomerase [Pseudomonadales bacterium]|nr:peptidylprolyl isomerase [Pseudomonadales bacterium]